MPPVTSSVPSPSGGAGTPGASVGRWPGMAPRFSLIVSSPLVRALQTAEIVAAELGYRGRIVSNELLVPEGAAARVVSYLRTVAAESSVALVAHEPILSALAAALTRQARHPALRKAEASHPAAGDDRGAPAPEGMPAGASTRTTAVARSSDQLRCGRRPESPLPAA